MTSQEVGIGEVKFGGGVGFVGMGRDSGHGRGEKERRVAGVLYCFGVLCCEEEIPLSSLEVGRVDVSFGSMVRTGREMRNQSQVSVVAAGFPVAGSNAAVGLVHRQSFPSTKIQGGEGCGFRWWGRLTHQPHNNPPSLCPLFPQQQQNALITYYSTSCPSCRD
jgi:hypothetical protein